MEKLEEEEEMTIRAVMDEKYYNETPTVKIYAAVLNSPKHTSKVVKSLNELLPVPKLQHLKRVKRHDGKTYVILDFISEMKAEEEEEKSNNNKSEEEVNFPTKRLKLDERVCLENLKSKGFNYEDFGIVGVETCDVPKHGPKTRLQYEKALEYWPVNFHPEKKVETMMSEKIFEESEFKYHVDNMKLITRMAKEKKKNVAMVVDFRTRQFIALGFDRVEEHPLQHAIMVAVDAVASTQNGGAWDLPFDELTSATTKPVLSDSSDDPVLNAGEEDLAPYLCTGYDVYVVREPCVMCAMSLVHSRVKRVFFHVRNIDKGALISKCQIHLVKDLNHHYEVFEMKKLEKPS